MEDEKSVTDEPRIPFDNLGDTSSSQEEQTDINDHMTVLFVQAVDWLSVYFSLLMILTGCVCNPLAFIVFSRRTYRYNSTSVYLRFLSLTDLGSILTGFTRIFIIRAFQIDIRGDPIFCQVHLFMIGLFLFCSSWALVVVTIERLVSILWPHHVHSVSSKTTVKLIILLVFVINCLLRLSFTFHYKSTSIFDPVTNSSSSKMCVLAPYSKTNAHILAIFSVIHIAFAPITIISICNVIILHGVIKSRKSVRKSTIPKRNVKHSQSPNISNALTENMSKTNVYDSERQKTADGEYGDDKYRNKNIKDNKTHTRSRNGRETSLTVTLLTITSSFVICNFPNAIYGPTLLFRSQQGISRGEVALRDLLEILMYTNNATNFALYCLTGSKFRAEARAMITEIIRFPFQAKNWDRKL